MTVSNIIKIWGILIALLALSITLGELKDARLATILIFGIATIKAYLVLMYYMGLKWEPRFISFILFSALAFMMVLFFYLVPDIVYGNK